MRYGSTTLKSAVSIQLSKPILEVPTSGLEPLTPAHYECAAHHLGATEQLNSRTAALSPKAGTDATLNGGLVVTPTHRCRKRRIATPLFLRHAPLLVAKSDPGSVRSET